MRNNTDRTRNSETRSAKSNRRVRLWVIAWMLLTLSGLVACGSSVLSVTPTPTITSLAEELDYYGWESDMPQSVLDAFTREYGVKVNYLTYEAPEQAIENMKAGHVYDVVTIESRLIPLLADADLLAEIDHRNVTNLKNISANFRELAYDPDNRYSVPYNWGTIGLIMRTDLTQSPIERWADLWDERYAGKVGLWGNLPREMIGLTLKSLGYSANSENPAELEAALAKLLLLKPNLRFLEDFDLWFAAPALASAEVAIATGWSGDMAASREMGLQVEYVLPEEGALLWNDAFVIPANSPNRHTAELFLNFLMRPDINAQIANENHYATPNEAAHPLIDPAILNDPVIFPSNESLENAELILPLSPAGQKLYDDIWTRFKETP